MLSAMITGIAESRLEKLYRNVSTRLRLQTCDTKNPLPDTTGLHINALMNALGEPEFT